jgi:hypothetical protein
MVALDLRVNDYHGTPVSIARQFFILDAALIRSGNASIDGDDRRRVQIARLVGFESSFLEHRAGELIYGPRQFSAVKLLQLARQGGVSFRSFSSGNLEEALEEIQWPTEFEDRMRDAAGRGLTVEAPLVGHAETGLGTFFGFIATDPVLGAGEYIVAFEAGAGGGLANGGVGEAGPGPDGGDAPTDCLVCQGNAPAGSVVHLLSGNYVHQETEPHPPGPWPAAGLHQDLQRPARVAPQLRPAHRTRGWRRAQLCRRDGGAAPVHARPERDLAPSPDALPGD